MIAVVGAAGLAVLALVMPPPASACSPEGTRLVYVRSDSTLIAIGQVSELGPGPTFAVRIDRVLKGRSPIGTPAFREDEMCPLAPPVGSRVLVAAAANGDVIAAWVLLADGSAYGYLTDPYPNTVAAVLDAFSGLPATSTVERPATPTPVTPLVAIGLVAFLLTLVRSSRMERKAGRRRRDTRHAASPGATGEPGLWT